MHLSRHGRRSCDAPRCGLSISFHDIVSVLTAGKDLAMLDCKRVTDGRLSLVDSKPGSDPRVVATDRELRDSCCVHKRKVH